MALTLYLDAERYAQLQRLAARFPTHPLEPTGMSVTLELLLPAMDKCDQVGWLKWLALNASRRQDEGPPKGQTERRKDRP